MFKKGWLIILSITLITFSLIGCKTGSKSDETTINGYLVDKHCSEMKVPSEETKKCLSMDSCKSSGYGVAVKQADGKYKFYKFDDSGQQLAIDILNETTKNKGISIVVKGLEENDELKVSSITEN